jgi:hypothetical protein
LLPGVAVEEHLMALAVAAVEFFKDMPVLCRELRTL